MAAAVYTAAVVRRIFDYNFLHIYFFFDMKNFERDFGKKLCSRTFMG